MPLPVEEEEPVSMPRPDADSTPSPKRRKLRKGTQSCWECKRRKAKCVFTTTRDVCDGCRRRGTDCISQELTEKPPSPRSNRHLVDRLGHVEASVRQLLEAVRHNEEERLILPVSSEIRRQKSQNDLGRFKSPSEHKRTSSSTHRPSAESTGSEEDRLTSESSQHQVSPSKERRLHVPSDIGPTDLGTYDPLSQDLLAAWPSPEDMDIILQVLVECPQAIQVVTGSETRRSPPPSPRHLLQLPTPEAPPVLIARKMLTLAIVLQAMPASSESHLSEKLSRDVEDIMSRLVKAARDLVTRDDDLVSSLEGVRCLMLEGLYENHAGNLRRAWIVARRSVTIAQAFGLNRGITPPSVDDDSAGLDDLWFRVVNFDRYLCLMLGLPQSSPNEPFANADVLRGYPANTRLQRLCSVATGLLLNRDAADMYDVELTSRIDELLRDASTSMPAQWWVTPGLTSDAGFADAVRVSIRSNDHLMQYHLVLQLHLPYLLSTEAGDDWDYHRMTAVTASREILTRFLVVHMTPKTRHYCRAIDLIAFMSCAALSLSHILCEQRHETIQGRRNYFLTQQRLSDRGLMEQTMAIAEEGVRKKDDDIFKRLVALLRCLFAFEDNVAAGFGYTAVFVPGLAKEQDLGHQIHASEDGKMAQIHLPHFPVIKIECQGSQEPQEKGLSDTGSLEFSVGSAPLLPLGWTDGANGEPLRNVPSGAPIPFIVDDSSANFQSTQSGFLAPEGYWATDLWGLEGG